MSDEEEPPSKRPKRDQEAGDLVRGSTPQSSKVQTLGAEKGTESLKEIDDTEDNKQFISRLLEAKRDDWTDEIKKIDDDTRLKRILQEIDNMINEAKRIMDIDAVETLGGLKREIQLNVKAREEERKEQQSRDFQRVASITVGLNTKMKQTVDLKRLIGRTNDLFQWHTCEETKNEWLAPYFVIVQSSGVGKTKLMKEMTKTDYDSVLQNTKRILILCSIGDKDLGEGVFDHVLDLSGFITTDNITKFLDSCVEQCQDYDKVVVMFDEAQHLIRRPDQPEEETEGFLLRVIRWWLRRKYPKHKKQVVAIFAGTSSSLTNFFAEPPLSSTSRDPVDISYHEDGTELLEPFYEICTIGLFSTGSDELDLPVENEYQRSIPFGRPLFPQIVLSEGWGEFQKKELTILRRILLSLPHLTNLADNIEACLCALATRVQMGQTSATVTSQFVAKGYAYLSYFNIGSKFSQAGFPPDPVLARLVMCLMTPGYKWPNSDQGPDLPENDDFWAKMATSMFSTGLCTPHKGDVGEVAVALCLLLTGDQIRLKVDKTLQTFSVSLQALLTSVAGFKKDPSQNLATGGPTVSFIQVCRNYLRFRGREGILFGEAMLKRFYQAGSAFYSASNTGGYDILAPVKYTTKSKDTDRYVPLLISCKARKDYSATQFFDDTKKMQGMLRNAGEGTQSQPRGVCLTILVGLDKPTLGKYNEKLAELNGVQGLTYESQFEKTLTRVFDGNRNDGIASLVVVIPEQDRFGITKLLEQTFGKGCVAGEVLQSHSVLRDAVFAESSKKDFVGDLLHSATRKGSDVYKLAHDLKKGFGVNSDSEPK